MQFTTILALAPLALAAPLETRQAANTFTVIATRSGSPFHLSPFTARNGGIFLSGDSGAYCPESTVDCTTVSNATSFGAQTGPNVGLGLNTVVPGGQQVYVTENGALGYTRPHSASIPAGASLAGFNYQPATDGAQFGSLSYNGNGAQGFVACKKDDAYQVFASIPGQDFSECLGLNGLATAYTGASAWEFSG